MAVSIVFNDDELEFLDDLVADYQEKADGSEWKLTSSILRKIEEHFNGKN